MIVEEPTTGSAAQAGASVPQLETRFSIARDAIANDRKHADEALRHFLQAAGHSLGEFRIDVADDSPLLDVRVLNALSAMKPCRDHFLELVRLCCNGPQASAAHEELRAFLGQTIALKQPPPNIIHFNHLWCDHYRFFIRELFLCTIALLLREEKYADAAMYLKSAYAFPSQSGQQSCNFLKFDAYIKSLDEFRARRLRQENESITADLMRERADLSYLGFQDLMQADFLLCVYGVLHYPDLLVRWCPRTLIHAGAYEENGFDIFFRAESLGHFGAVAAILDVRDKKDLVERFEHSRRQGRLDQWKMGGRPIPFDRYMGLRQTA